MKMRWLTPALLVALLAPAGIVAQGSRSTKPVIEIPVTNHDFGEVFKTDKFRHAFTVYNRGNADLIIEAVKPG